MAIFDKEIMDKAAQASNEWIKATEFDGKGLTLQINGVEKIKSNYGAKAEDAIVERDILEEGETFRYTFKDADGNERKHDSSSFPMFIGMKSVEVNYGDWLHIRREGKKDKTKYFAEAVDAPISQSKPSEKTDTVEYPEEELDPKNIPF